jgi:hypothetical protein
MGTLTPPFSERKPIVRRSRKLTDWEKAEESQDEKARPQSKECDSAEKPPHFDLCSALRNAADTNIKLSIDKLLWPTLPKPAK